MTRADRFDRMENRAPIPAARAIAEEGGVNESSSDDHGQQMSPVPAMDNGPRTSPPAAMAREATP